MFERIREDYRTHGRRWSERAVWALLHYRFGAWALGLRFAPLRWACGKIYAVLQIVLPIITGVWIDRRMVVGRRFHVVHAGMIALHPHARFGDDCGIMHNVTVGTNMTGVAPTIGNDVFIGCGAAVLGEITIGDGVRIAANSLVIGDVPAGALAMGVPARIYPGRGHGPIAAEARRASSERLKPAPAAEAPPATASLFRGVPSDADAPAR